MEDGYAPDLAPGQGFDEAVGGRGEVGVNAPGVDAEEAPEAEEDAEVVEEGVEGGEGGDEAVEAGGRD